MKCYENQFPVFAGLIILSSMQAVTEIVQVYIIAHLVDGRGKLWWLFSYHFLRMIEIVNQCKKFTYGS